MMWVSQGLFDIVSSSKLYLQHVYSWSKLTKTLNEKYSTTSSLSSPKPTITPYKPCRTECDSFSLVGKCLNKETKILPNAMPYVWSCDRQGSDASMLQGLN